MLGLGAYESSSEDDAKGEVSLLNGKSAETPSGIVGNRQRDIGSKGHNGVKTKLSPQPALLEPSGPLIGPSRPDRTDSPPNEYSQSTQSSPFSTTRALIHDMTLPPIPNFDIPPSPPGSPNPVANPKFIHFLSLKSQGIHFNEKLAGSSSLKNPNLLLKLKQHAGIDEQEQYATSLPSEIWDISMLPEWGFKDKLLKTQQAIRSNIEEKRAAGQREPVEFLPAAVSREGTSHGGRNRPSAAERVTTGLNRDGEIRSLISDRQP